MLYLLQLSKDLLADEHRSSEGEGDKILQKQKIGTCIVFLEVL